MVKIGSLGNVDTVIGRCPHCNNEALLISIVYLILRVKKY